MRYEVSCECGWHATGTRDELIVAVGRHGREVHGLELSEEQVVAQLKPVEG